MKHDTLNEALSQVRDEYVAEATAGKKRNPLRWAGPIAAVLAVAILWGCFALIGNGGATEPTIATGVLISDKQVAAPIYPKMAAYPDESILGYGEEFSKAYDAWQTDQKAQKDQPKGYADSALDFFGNSVTTLLSNAGDQNLACSPLNIYTALAMVTETTGGQTQQELLDVLGADSIEALRTQASSIWNAHYCDDNATATILANSLWLNEAVEYNQETVALLADSYYASVFQGQLGTPEMNGLLQTWLDEQTGGLLSEQARNVELDPEAVMALASTIYYRCKWTDRFQELGNEEGIFRSPDQDRTVTYMNTELIYGRYFWGENYGATYLNLEDGSRMWLILPDEGKTPADVIASSEFWEQVQTHSDAEPSENSKNIRIDLKLPKFDICSELKLKDSLTTLGIQKIFSMDADFSPIMPSQAAFIGQADHAARVAIDEEGVTAAAYTVMTYCGAGAPIGDIMDFTLDRPFIFLIQSQDHLPLFAGVVNQP